MTPTAEPSGGTVPTLQLEETMTAVVGDNRFEVPDSEPRFVPGRRLFERYLKRLIEVGRLTVRLDGDRSIVVGTVPSNEPELDVVLRLRGRWSLISLALDPEYRFGELYSSGKLSIERGSLTALMEIVGRNLQRGAQPTGPFGKVLRLSTALLDQGNSTFLARHYAAFHYDISEAMYRAFLDRDMQYSCAYFEDAEWDLDKAQQAKVLHIAAKLDLEPGQRVLDIGCGWGGLALTLARTCNVDVVGVTLSPQQLKVAKARAEAEGLSGRVSFELRDYREATGQFDRIVSVGMLEHVGRGLYDQFFDTVQRLLKPDGVALIHSIGRKDFAGGENRWIRKRIFPGGYIPRLSQLTEAVERTGMWITDVEILRLHYARTLRHWRDRFTRSCSDLLRDNPRFYRTWEFYLASCEMSFRHYGLMNIQLQLARDVGILPVTRGYMADAEEGLRSELDRPVDCAAAFRGRR